MGIIILNGITLGSLFRNGNTVHFGLVGFGLVELDSGFYRLEAMMSHISQSTVFIIVIEI